MYSTSNGSSLESRDGLYVLRLYGNPYARGRAHGELLKKQILDSNISRYYGNYLLDLYKTSDLAKKMPQFVQKSVGALLEAWYYSPLERLLLPESKEELYGIADAAGLSRVEVLRGYVAPDIMTHLAAVFLTGGERVESAYQGGCSGVYAGRKAMRGKAPALFARNMDFPGVFVWKYPAVIFSYPEEEVETLCETGGGAVGWVKKKKNPYVYIAAAGFPGNGLTGMSSKGVAMSTFVCLSRNISRRGMLTLDFNHFLLTRTENLAGIRSLMRDGGVNADIPVCATPHAIVFADGGEAFALETDSVKADIVPMDADVHIQTNHYKSAALKKEEFAFPLEEENTIGRYRLLKSAVDHHYGKIDLQKITDIISCNVDMHTGTVRLLGDVPAQPTTLTSVIFEPETLKFWVAAGVPPAVCYNRYTGFVFNEKRNYRVRGRLKRSHTPVLPGMERKPVTKEMLSSLRYCMLSQEDLKLGKISAALRNIRKAIELYPEPGYSYILALLCMKAGGVEESLAICEHCLSGNLFSGAKQQALVLWKARALDLLGGRKEALVLYRSLSADEEGYTNIRQAARRHIRKPFTRDNLPGAFDYTLLGPYIF